MNRLTGAPKTLLVETINDIKLNKLVGWKIIRSHTNLDKRRLQEIATGSQHNTIWKLIPQVTTR